MDFNPTSQAGKLPGIFGPSPAANLGLTRPPALAWSKDDILNNFASLTIQTTPEQADEVIAWIDKFTRSGADFSLFSQNCTTECSEALHILGICTGDPITPGALWDNLFPRYSTTGDLATMGHYPAEPGHEYGTPGIGNNPTIPYSVGRLTQISNGISTTNYLAYDVLSRVASSQQITAARTYNFSYSYNLAGSLTSETYPSGRVMNVTYDNAIARRRSRVSSQAW